MEDVGEGQEIAESNNHRKLPNVEIQGACIDPVSYQIVAAFHDPAI